MATIQESLRSLTDALVLRRALELIGHGLRPPRELGVLPGSVIELLLSSPSKLREAVQESESQLRESDAALGAALRDLVNDASVRWAQLDSEVVELDQSRSGSEIIRDAHQEAVRRYWLHRKANAREECERVEEVFAKCLALESRLALLAAAASGLKRGVPEDAPADLLLALGKPNEIERMQRETSEELKRVRGRMGEIAAEIFDRRPHAVAPGEIMIAGMTGSALRWDGAPTLDRLRQLYGSKVGQVHNQGSLRIIGWLFSWRGRCERWQYWSVWAVWCVVLTGITVMLPVSVRRAERIDLFAIFVALIGVYSWSHLTLDVRRIRDTGRNPKGELGTVAVAAALFRMVTWTAPALLGLVTFGICLPFYIWLCFARSRPSP